MATILSCGACGYPVIVKWVAPAVVAEREMDVTCPECGAIYNILIRMIKEPAPVELEMAKGRRKGE